MTFLKKIKPDHIATLLFLFFGLYVIRDSRDLQYWTEMGPGPGCLPLILGIAITLFSFLLMMELLRKGAPQENPLFAEGVNLKKVLLAMIGYTILTVLMDKLGFLILSAFFIAFITGVVERRPWINVLLITALGTVGFYFLFVFLLEIPLPQGILGK